MRGLTVQVEGLFFLKNKPLHFKGLLRSGQSIGLRARFTGLVGPLPKYTMTDQDERAQSGLGFILVGCGHGFG